MKYLRAYLVTAFTIKLTALLFASFAHADPYCDAMVIDGANVISDQKTVAAAAGHLADRGLTVRVRTYASAPDLDQRAREDRSRCSDWRSGDAWKTTLLLFAYTPDRRQQGIYFGAANAPRLSGKWQDVLRDRFTPRANAGEVGPAFVAALDELTVIYARPSAGGNVTVTSTVDYSGTWKLFLLGFFGLFLLAGMGFWWYQRRQAEVARAEARRVRATCIAGVLEITDAADRAVLQVRGPASSYARYERRGDQAAEAFSRFDNLDGADPNVGLSAHAYEINRKAYEDILERYVQPARKIAAEIRAGKSEPAQASFIAGGDPPYRSSKPFGRDDFPKVENPHEPIPPSAPIVTPERVVVVDRGGSGDFLTGALVGSMLTERQVPRYEEPPRQRSSHNSDSDSGGSYSSRDSSSSDSGGSYSSSDSSSSDSGGSSSSNC